MTGANERGLCGPIVDHQRLAGPDVVGLFVHDDLDRPLEVDLGEGDAGKWLLPVHRIACGDGRNRRDGQCSENGDGDHTHSSHSLQSSRYGGFTLIS